MENILPQNPQPQFTPNSQVAPSTSSNTLKMAVIGLLVLLPIVALGGYYLGKSTTKDNVSSDNPLVMASPSSDQGVACTMDAKVCPDGSSVGRMGPNCEFAECPVSNLELKVYQGRMNPFTISYPSNFMPEISDVDSATDSIEQVIFKTTDSSSALNNFSVYISSNPTGKVPQYPLDHEPTGSYVLGGQQAVYVELPEGYGDGLGPTFSPMVAVFAHKDGKLYKITFLGVANINDPTIQQILKSFTFTK